MPYQDVRDEIQSLLSSVAGIGQVHGFRRHSAFWDKYYENALADGTVNIWEISREGVTQEINSVQNKAGSSPLYWDSHNIVITGHMALSDELETEDAFQDLIERIRDVIRLISQISFSPSSISLWFFCFVPWQQSSRKPMIQR